MSEARTILERLRAQSGDSPAKAPTRPVEADSAPIPRQHLRAPKLTGNALFEAFVKYAKAEPQVLERLAHRFEWKTPFAKAKPVPPCPLLKATGIEFSVNDNGKPKTTARDRPEREAMRYRGNLKLFVGSNKQTSNPDWVGWLEWRNGARAKEDTRKHVREGNFTQAFADMITGAVDNIPGDNLFGFVRADGRAQEAGSPHVSGFVFVADRAGMEALNPSVTIYALDDKGAVKIELPRLDTRTSKGNPLGGKMVLQCRASRTAWDWATGTYEFARFGQVVDPAQSVQ